MRQIPIASVLLTTVLNGAQTPAGSTAQTLTGCVARVPSTTDRYVLASGNRCMLLSGAYKAAQIADHEITVQGLVIEPAGMAPLTFQVQSVVSTKAACAKTCVLEPPGTRGIHGKEVPGKEGATRGVTQQPATTPN